MRERFSFFPVLVLVSVAIVALGAPEILPTSHPSNDLFVDGAVDFISFAGGSFTLSFGQSIQLESPDGRRMEFTLTNSGSDPFSDGPGSPKFFLDGTYVGPANRHWDVSGDMDGASINGTFTVTFNAKFPYQSGCSTSPPPVVLSIGGKTLTFGYSSATTTINNPQLWNWHIAPTNVTDNEMWLNPPNENCTAFETSEDVIGVTTGVLSTWENPDNSRFYFEPGASDPNPRGATGGSVVTCPSTAQVNGTWVRGTTQTLNSFASFFWIDGPFNPALTPGFPSEISHTLQDNYPGVTETTRVDKGAGASGSHTATIPYNNAVGNSYRFVIRNGTGGPANPGAGQVQQARTFFIPSGLCAIGSPSLAGFMFDSNEFDVTVSQAQCAGDKVAFSVNSDGAGTLVDLDVFIYDTETGLVILAVDDSAMFHEPVGSALGFWMFNRTLAVGPWMALARGEYSGIGSIDFFATKAFNVPLGTCLDIEDNMDVIGILVQHNQSMHQDHLDIIDLINGLGNLTVDILSFGFEVDGTTTVNVFLLLLFGALAVWIYMRSGNILGKTLGACCALVGALLAVEQVADWVGMLVVFLILIFLGAYLFLRAAVDFATKRKLKYVEEDGTGQGT